MEFEAKVNWSGFIVRPASCSLTAAQNGFDLLKMVLEGLIRINTNDIKKKLKNYLYFMSPKNFSVRGVSTKALLANPNRRKKYWNWLDGYMDGKIGIFFLIPHQGGSEISLV